MVDYDKIINDKTDEILLLKVDNETKRLILKIILLPIATLGFWCGYYQGYMDLKVNKIACILSHITTT
jgi:hypothetical protein